MNDVHFLSDFFHERDPLFRVIVALRADRRGWSQLIRTLSMIYETLHVMAHVLFLLYALVITTRLRVAKLVVCLNRDFA